MQYWFFCGILMKRTQKSIFGGCETCDPTMMLRKRRDENRDEGKEL